MTDKDTVRFNPKYPPNYKFNRFLYERHVSTYLRQMKEIFDEAVKIKSRLGAATSNNSNMIVNLTKKISSLEKSYLKNFDDLVDILSKAKKKSPIFFNKTYTFLIAESKRIKFDNQIVKMIERKTSLVKDLPRLKRYNKMNYKKPGSFKSNPKKDPLFPKHLEADNKTLLNEALEAKSNNASASTRANSSKASQPKVNRFFSFKNMSHISLHAALYYPVSFVSSWVEEGVQERYFKKSSEDVKYASSATVNLSLNALADIAFFKAAVYGISKLPQKSIISGFLNSMINGSTMSQFVGRGFAIGLSAYIGYWTGGKLYKEIEKTKNTNSWSSFYYKHITSIGIPFRGAGEGREFYFDKHTVQWQTRWVVKPVKKKDIRSISYRFKIRPDLLTEEERAFLFQWQRSDYREKIIEYIPFLVEFDKDGYDSLKYDIDEYKYYTPLFIRKVSISDYFVDWETVEKRARDGKDSDAFNKPIIFIKNTINDQVYPIPNDKVYTLDNLKALGSYLYYAYRDEEKAISFIDKIKPISENTTRQKTLEKRKPGGKKVKKDASIRLMYYRAKACYYVIRVFFYLNYFASGSTKIRTKHASIKKFDSKYIGNNILDFFNGKTKDQSVSIFKNIESDLVAIKREFQKKSKRFNIRYKKYKGTYLKNVKKYKEYKTRYLQKLTGLSSEELKSLEDIGQKEANHMTFNFEDLATKSGRKSVNSSINQLAKKITKKRKTKKRL